MKTIQRLVILLLVLLGCTTGAWALEQDSDGYYLIGSVQDWEDFASIVATTNDANAKMIADVDLGDCQAKLGHPNENRPSYYFKGEFDGQGYTLTVHYIKDPTNSNAISSPFPNISGATIKNLHIDGTLENSTSSQPAPIGICRSGTSTVENVWSSLVTTDTRTGWDEAAALVGCVDGYTGGNLIMKNCLFTGSVNSSGSYNGCFVGYINSGGSATITNCLSLGTFNYTGGSSAFRGNHTNCYVSSFLASYPSGVTKPTDEELSDGTITTALGEAWAQDPGTGQPMLKIFTTLRQDEDGYYLIGSVTDWRRFAAIVETTPTANAKMIRDVDLGDDQTTIGSPRNGGNIWYQGTFDGDGHTLTIAYNNTSGEIFTTPFSLIQGATIKNLHLDGTVNTVYAYGGSVASIGRGSNTLKNIWNSVTSVCTMGGWDQMGAFFGVLDSGGSMDVSDCLFTGSMSHPGGYSGYFSGGYGPGPHVSNCLVLGEFTGSYGFNGAFTNCYLKHASTTGVTIPTDEELANGTTATALQNDRTEEVWVQDAMLNQPMLKIFATLAKDADGYCLIGSVEDWKNFATLVNNGIDPAANAKMIADIDLGDDQTMMGINASTPYQGIFDGQGHTLTVNINATGVYVAVFRYVNGATIQGIHIAGSLHSDEVGLGGLVGSGSNTTIRQCRVSALLTTDKTYSGVRHSIGGIFSEPGESVLMEDCLFDGRIADQNNHFCGGFSNYSPYAVTIKNSLNLGIFPPCASGYSSETATFIRTDAGAGESHVLTNLFYLNSFGIIQGTQATETTLIDGSVTTALNNGQTGEEAPWVQDPTTGTPMLKLFAKDITYTVPSSGIGTFSAKGQVLLPEGLSAHYCTVYHKKNSTISVVNIDGNIVPAATGVLLSGTPGETFTLTGASGQAPTITDNELVAVTESKHINATDGDYTNFMMSGGKFIKIQQDDESVKMPANRAYLPLLTDAVGNAKIATLLWETTAIEHPVEKEDIGERRIYNISGQQLKAPQKGFNIINGRKVIVK